MGAREEEGSRVKGVRMLVASFCDVNEYLVSHEMFTETETERQCYQTKHLLACFRVACEEISNAFKLC